MHFDILLLFIVVFQDVFCRSINIDFSHKYHMASDDYEEQESVDLNELEINLRNELEMNVKQYQEQLKVVNFEIPANETETNTEISDENESRKNPLHNMLGVAVPETTKNGNSLVDHSSLPPPEARVNPRLKRSAKNPGFETSPQKAESPKTNAAIDKMQKMLLKKVLIYVAVGITAVLVVLLLCICCGVVGPKTCFIATITCPCCLILFPCVTMYIKDFLDPETILSDNTYSYVPGIMVHENGKIQKYTPSPEEIEAVRDIIEIVNRMEE